MTASDYKRPLQTTLDDTLGGLKQNSPRFERIDKANDHSPRPIGVVKLRDGNTRTVYDGQGLAPDLSRLSPGDRFIWVLAHSVFWSKRSVVRKVESHEILSIWDYEGKIELEGLGRWIKASRLASPPAKIVRIILIRVCQIHQPHEHTAVEPSELLAVGRTIEVPFSPLEVMGNI